MRPADDLFAAVPAADHGRDGGFAPIALPEGWPRAELSIAPQWLAPEAADAAMVELMAQIAWDTHRIRLFGREVDAPRLSCWIGDPGAAYTYSRTRFEPRPWPRALLPIRDRLQAETGGSTGSLFNSVLANLYRDGRDSMGWHSDDEPELGPRPLIASLSLGAERRFLLKPRDRAFRGQRAFALALPPGSLLLMAGDTQRHYRHALPATARPVGPRLNLTFRRVIGAGA